jgi:hypothetical protein
MATYTFLDGDFDDPNDWSPQGVPGAGDTILDAGAGITAEGETVANAKGIDGDPIVILGGLTITNEGYDLELQSGDYSVGTIEGAAYIFNGAAVTAGSVDLTLPNQALGLGDSLSDTSSLAVVGSVVANHDDIAIDTSGTFNVGGGVSVTKGGLAIDGGATTIGGQIGLATGSYLDLYGGTATAGSLNVDGSSVTVYPLGSKAMLKVKGDATFSKKAALYLYGGGQTTAETLKADGNSAIYDQGAGSTLTVNKTLTLSSSGSGNVKSSISLDGGTLSIVSGAYLGVGPGSSGSVSNELKIGKGGKIVGTGAVTSTVTGKIPIGNTTTPKYSLTVAGDGTIEANSAAAPAAFALVIDGNVTGDVQMKIDADSTLEIGGSVGEKDRVTFASNGTGQLVLDDPAQFKGTIAGMTIGDGIILKNISPSNGDAVFAATIGLLENGVNLQLYEFSQPSSPNPQYIPMDLSIELDPPDEFFNVTRSENDTVLTLTKGNPIAQSIGAQTAQGQPATSYSGKTVTIGVISFGPELTAMEDIIKEVAPGATIITASAAPGDLTALTNGIISLRTADVIVDDLGPGYPAAFSDPFGIGLGGDTSATAINAVVQAGKTYVTAAGNNFPLPVLGHNAVSSAITVASMNWLATPPGDPVGGYLPQQTESNSSLGKIDVTGPDGGPTSVGLEDFDLDPFFGTSAAAPAVAAVVALMMEKDFQLKSNPELVKQILKQTAVNINGNPLSQGAGLVQAAAALAATPTPSSFDPAPEPGLSVLSAALSQPAGDVDTGSTLELQLTMSEGVTVTGAPAFVLSDGGLATYDAAASDPSAGVLMFDYTVAAGQQATDLTVASLSANGATVKDSSGASANFSGLFNQSIGVTINSPLAVKSVASNVSGEAQTGQSAQLTLTMNEAVTVDTAGGAPTLSLSNGGTASYDSAASNPSAGTLAFTYTVGANDDPSPNLSVFEVNLPTGTTVQDAQGDNADFSGALNRDTGLQVGAAFVDGFTVSPTSAASTGQTVKLTLTMSEGVTVDTAGGSPTLTLNDGETAKYDPAASKPSAGKLVFDYTVASKDQTPDLEITQVLNGASVRDVNGVDVSFSEVLDFPAEFSINSPLVVTKVSASPTGDVSSGHTIHLMLTMSEALSVDSLADFGPPTLTLNDGATATYDYNLSKPSSGALVFDYKVGPKDQTPDLAITRVNVQGAIFADSQGNLPDYSAALNVDLGVAVGPPTGGGDTVHLLGLTADKEGYFGRTLALEHGNRIVDTQHFLGSYTTTPSGAVGSFKGSGASLNEQIYNSALLADSLAYHLPDGGGGRGSGIGTATPDLWSVGHGPGPGGT